MSDGETSTSRIIGSVDFKLIDKFVTDAPDDELLVVISGTRCCMPFTVKVGKASGMNLGEINQIIFDIFDKVEKTLSNWNPDSEVNKVNALRAGECHEMSDMLREVILCSKDLVKSTNGAFDPSVGPILKHYESNAWNNLTESNHDSVHSIDSNEESKQRAVINVWKDLLSLGYSSDPKDLRVSKKVQKLLEISHWFSAFSVKERKFISKKHDGARLDLSGIAKGFTIDEIVKSLPSPCYVEWGGDLKVKGLHPSGRPWQVAVVQPPNLQELQKRLDKAKCDGQLGPIYTLSPYESENKGSYSKKHLAVFDLSDGDAITTSGDSEKVVEREGKIYSHIINPGTGRMLEINDSTLALAVVICKSCMVADALSTAAIGMEDPSLARAMLEPLRTRFREPLRDFLLYSRYGPRVIRLSIPGVEPKEFKQQRLEKHKPCKVIVVGSGLAGLSAAIEAADARAHVVVLEKEPMTGGNSSKATSGINGWGTYTQALQNVPDDERLFERDTHRSGKGGTTNPSLVRALSIQSAQSIHWLQQKFGIPLTVLSQLGGHSTKRTHRVPPDENDRPVPVGFLIMQTMKKYIELHYSNQIEIKCGAKVKELIHSIDKEGVKTVNGVKVEINGSNVEEYADSIILATGGFGCCRALDGLMSKYRPDLLGFPTTNGSFAQGDGVVLGEKIGAKLIDMDKIQLHPTGFIDRKNPSNPTKILAPEAIRGCGGILVSSKGERFVNELDLRSVVAKAILEHCSPYKDESYVGPPFAWCILSKESQELFGTPTLEFYKDRLGLFDSCADIKEMASLIGCDEDTLFQTLQSYSDAKRRGTCMKTLKDIFPSDVSPLSKDFVLARVTPSIHYTMGGLSISVSGEVLEPLSGHFGSHRHIRNLYAAGEVTGGVHGANRLAGNSLLECVVFGRAAGERAATVLQPDKVMFPSAQSDDLKSRSVWEPVVLREIRNTDDKYQKNTIEVRFNLHGSTQHSGLDVGQFIGLRGDLDGETLMGYFSPITRPDDEGVIGILCRNDDKGGHVTKLIRKLRPGSVMHMCPMGGLRLKFENDKVWFRCAQIHRINLIAGGTGIAPMIQVIRAYSRHVRNNGGNISGGLNLIYAAEDESDLAFMKLLNRVHDDFPRHFKFYVKLNAPPLGWTEGVGYIDARDIRKHLAYPQRDGDLNIVCGPPIFENAMLKLLAKQGFFDHQIYSFSSDEKVACSSP